MAEALDSRTTILAAARTALVEGQGEIEMAAVARRAGVSVGLAYHYFGSKAGLLAALVEEFYDRYDAVLNQRFSDQLTWPEREHLRLCRTIRFLFDDPVAPVMLGRLSGSAHVVAAEATRRESIIERGARNIRRAQERGEVDPTIDAVMAAALINGGLRQAVSLVLSQPAQADPDRFVEQAWRLIAGALRLPLDTPWPEVRTG
jgi:AcrR family transcriptional regulator